jgi:ParB-like chromosome segregation protein Spo0J
MSKRVKLACKLMIAKIEIEKVLPLRIIAPGTRTTSKYRCIAASIREVGIIEPLVVHPHNQLDGHYMLLDGHIRLEILKELEKQTVDCLISTDDEAYTYNHKVNRLSAIQEHFMILKAIKDGVSEEDIARTLNVDVASIRKKRDLLDSICPEAVQLLKGKRATAGGLRELRKVKPMRQIEMAELMCASHNFSITYAKCLTTATPEDQLVEPENRKETDGLSSADIARMEREMETLSGDFKQIEAAHGKNVLNFVVVVGYLKKLLDNARIVRYLAQSYPEILDEFQKIVESRSLSSMPVEE